MRRFSASRARSDSPAMLSRAAFVVELPEILAAISAPPTPAMPTAPVMAVEATVAQSITRHAARPAEARASTKPADGQAAGHAFTPRFGGADGELRRAAG